jgi:hypothetical protein
MRKESRTEPAAENRPSDNGRVAGERRLHRTPDVRSDAAEVEQFVDWFCAYWRERGATLFADLPTPEVADGHD